MALSLDDSGMTDDMQKVWNVADGLIKRLEDDGVPPDHIYVDPLIRPVSTNGEYGMGALWVVEKITAAHPLVHKTCGLSNVSYGFRSGSSSTRSSSRWRSPGEWTRQSSIRWTPG